MNYQQKESAFGEALRTLINKYSKENNSDTPDFILADYLVRCLQAYETTVRNRDKWFGVDMWASDKLISTKPEPVEPINQTT